MSSAYTRFKGTLGDLMELQCMGNLRSITYFKANFYTACMLFDNDLAIPFGGQIFHRWNSRFSISSTKTTTYMVIRRFRSREICFTWRNWRLTCTTTQRVTTCCILLRVLLRHEYMTCMCWRLPLWHLGCRQIWQNDLSFLTILTWVSLVMKLKWIWVCERVWEF